MKTTLPVLLTLLLLGAVIVTPITTKGQTHEPTPNLEIDRNDIADADNDSEEDDEPVQRVARITYIQGDVSFLRSGVTEWSDVIENLPLLTGDQIYVGSGGRAEIQFGRGNYVRLSEKTALTITELTHTAALLEVTEGIAIIRLEKYGSAWERFEVDTPNSALVLKQDGLYRVNVRGEDDSEIIIRRGLAEVFADDGNFKVREGQRLTIDTSPNGKLQIAIDNSNDEWDRWTYDRDRQADYIALSSAPDYVRQYETDYSDFYGASDLTSYGSWTSYSGYGNCWVPRVSSGWAPYRSGQWIWIPRAGWTWLSNEPWGWAPYHYGRWVHINNIGWAWAPGFNNHRYRYGHSYYRWRPALVSFFNCPTPRGNYVGWYPLAPGQRWRRSGNFGGDGFRGNNGHRHLQYPVARDANRRPGGGGNGNGNGGNRPRFGNGVTVLPIEGFAGQGRTKFRPIAPNTELSNSFHKGARAGLPDLGSNANSFVNTRVAKPGDSSNGFRAVVKPPQEVFTRPVVTRQRITETQAENAAPRERRFIGTPGTRPYGNEIPNNKRTRGGEVSSGGETTSGETKFERKQRMKNGDSAGGTVNNGSSNTANGNGGIITDDIIRKRARGAGEETTGTRKGEASNNGDTSDNGKTRNRPTPVGQPEGEADSSARKRERANRNHEGSATDDKASRRVYVPREQPQEDTSNTEQRRQEKQQRREQQQQQEQQDQQQQQQQKEQRRAERQEQEKQQQQQQDQQREQRRAERQQQEQQQREQQQQEQRRAEKQQQQQEQQRREEHQQQQRREERRQQQEQQRQQQQQQEQQQRQQQQEQQRQQEQRREEKQQRRKGDN